MRILHAIILTIICSYSNGQVQIQWSIIHVPFGNSNNSCFLKSDQLLLSSGNVIGGWTFHLPDSDAYSLGVTSYNVNGNFNWEGEYHGSFSGNGGLIAIDTDSLNNIYITGKVNENTAYSDNVILKYDGAGNVIWTEGDDSIETAGINGLVLSGNYYLLTELHPSLLQFDLFGNFLDSISIDSISQNSISFRGIIRSRLNNIIHGGTLINSSLPDYKIYWSKANMGNQVLWKNAVSVSGGYNQCEELAIDTNGNIFMLVSADVGTTNEHIIVIAINGITGDTLWTNPIKSPLNYESYPSDIDIDDANHVYIVGHALDTSVMRYQTRIIQFDALTGIQNWFIDFDSTFAYWLKLSKMSINSITKDVYVAYNQTSTTSLITNIIKIDTSGNVQWRCVFDSIGTVEAFLFDQLNSFYIGGSYLTKLSLITDIDGQINTINEEINAHFMPISNTVSISANSLKGQQYNLSIHDASGRIVYNEQGQTSNTFEKSIPFSRRKNGLYLVVLETEKERLTGKVVVY